MRTATYVFVVLALVTGIPALVQASIQVSNGDTIKLANGPGNGPGGSFEVENVTTASGPDLFRTFCIERNEFVAFGTSYYVTLESNAIFGGYGVVDVVGAGAAGVLNSFDPLSPLTAWLYSNAVGGTLAGYSASNASNNDSLQDAIWYLENEISGPPSGLAKTFYDAAVAAAPTDIGSVRVMNLWTSAGTAYTQNGKAQSLLTIVPEATNIVVWSVLGLIGVGTRRQRG